MSITPRRLLALRHRIAKNVVTQPIGSMNQEERDYEHCIRLAILKLLEAENSYTPFMVKINGHVATSVAMSPSVKKK